MTDGQSDYCRSLKKAGITIRVGGKLVSATCPHCKCFNRVTNAETVRCFNCKKDFRVR